MPQEFQVLQCYSCETFQVDIIKKIPKWVCKICGEKQSVKKIFNKGNSKECRLLVQQQNECRVKSENETLNVDREEKLLQEAVVQAVKHELDNSRNDYPPTKGFSKWNHFNIDN